MATKKFTGMIQTAILKLWTTIQIGNIICIFIFKYLTCILALNFVPYIIFLKLVLGNSDSYDEIKKEFGEEVAELVDGVTKLGGVEFDTRKEKQAENLMKMFLSMANDLRVVIIKFADRLHNMRTIEYLPLIKQRRIAVETRDIYSPLAHRLGMFQVKSELDDLVLNTITAVF